MSPYLESRKGTAMPLSATRENVQSFVDMSSGERHLLMAKKLT